MSQKRAFNLGVFAGMLLIIGAQALHWFITPHPEASSVRAMAVTLQALVSFGTAAGIYLYHRRATHASDAA